MNLIDKLTALKEHCQYMINMLALDQTLMNIDHATLTDLFNDAQPAQANSLKWADNKIAALRADNAKLREALEVMVYTVDGLVPDKSRTVKDAIAIARRVLEEANA